LDLAVRIILFDSFWRVDFAVAGTMQRSLCSCQGQHFNTQHLEEMGCKFGEALARLKARHMMRSLPLQGSSSISSSGAMMLSSIVAASAVPSTGADTDSPPPLPPTTSSTFVDDDFTTYVLVTRLQGGSVAEWLACWTQVQKGFGSNRSHDAVG